jgi:hypothetical protein
MGNELSKKRLSNASNDFPKKKRFSFLRASEGWLLIILLEILINCFFFRN